MNKIKYLLALIVFLATSCEIELKTMIRNCRRN